MKFPRILNGFHRTYFIFPGSNKSDVSLCGNEINEVTGLNDPQKVQVQAAHGRGADPTALPANIAVVYRSTLVLWTLTRQTNQLSRETLDNSISWENASSRAKVEGSCGTLEEFKLNSINQKSSLTKPFHTFQFRNLWFGDAAGNRLTIRRADFDQKIKNSISFLKRENVISITNLRLAPLSHSFCWWNIVDSKVTQRVGWKEPTR